MTGQLNYSEAPVSDEEAILIALWQFDPLEGADPVGYGEAVIAMGDEQVFCGGSENLLSEEEERKLLSTPMDSSKA